MDVQVHVALELGQPVVEPAERGQAPPAACSRGSAPASRQGIARRLVLGLHHVDGLLNPGPIAWTPSAAAWASSASMSREQDRVLLAPYARQLAPQRPERRLERQQSLGQPVAVRRTTLPAWRQRRGSSSRSGIVIAVLNVRDQRPSAARRRQSAGRRPRPARRAARPAAPRCPGRGGRRRPPGQFPAAAEVDVVTLKDVDGCRHGRRDVGDRGVGRRSAF